MTNRIAKKILPFLPILGITSVIYYGVKGEHLVSLDNPIHYYSSLIINSVSNFVLLVAVWH